jgi:potassium-dependent mechanosensitive channel
MSALDPRPVRRAQTPGAAWWRLPVLLLALAWSVLQPASGNMPASPPLAPAPAAAPQAIEPALILERAEQDQRTIDRSLRRLSRPDPMHPLEQALAAVARPVEAKWHLYGSNELRQLPVLRLESLDRHWAFDERQFRQWQADFRRQTGALAEDAAQLTRLRAQWDATRSAAAAADMPQALADRVGAMQAELAAAEQALSPLLTRQIELGQRARLVDTRIQAGRDEVTDAIADIDWRLLQRDAPALWALGKFSLAAPHQLAAMQRGLDIELRFATDYAAVWTVHQTITVAVQAVLLPLLLWAAWRSRRPALDAGAGGTQAPHADPLQRPFSAWLLLAALTTLAFKADAPLLTREIILLLAVVPLLRLLPSRILSGLSPWPQIAITLYALNWLCLLVMDNSTLYRLLQLGLAGLTLGAALWLLHAARSRSSESAVLPGLLRPLTQTASVLLALGVLAHVVGNVTLGETLINTVFDAGYFGLLLHTGLATLRELLQLLLRLAEQRRLPLPAPATTLLAVATKLLGAAALLGWLLYVADSLRLLRPLQAGLAAVLGYRFEIGEISLSTGDVLVFLVSVFIAFWAARLVRGVLRGRLREAASLPRGAGNSIASLSYYAVLLLGFLMALSAAGFQVSQLALVFGALGVGIGFGLQSIVANFVAGLVLMFERPIQPGDVIEIGDTSGRVRQIGLRATVVRTFEGADVVVPNSTLLSGNLLNWTLFDRSRRVEAKIGVSYDADVSRVLEVLHAAARSTPGAAQDPPPAALFSGYGDSSLDFVVRVWTHDFDTWVTLRGQLLARVVQALREADIVVPYNQLDVNLRPDPGAQPAPPPGAPSA